jgi:hypothetical protein
MWWSYGKSFDGWSCNGTSVLVLISFRIKWILFWDAINFKGFWFGNRHSLRWGLWNSWNSRNSGCSILLNFSFRFIKIFLKLISCKSLFGSSWNIRCSISASIQSIQIFTFKSSWSSYFFFYFLNNTFSVFVKSLPSWKNSIFTSKFQGFVLTIWLRSFLCKIRLFLLLLSILT